MTRDEIITEGLSTGKDAPLEVRNDGISSRGVFATGHIHKGEWLCEYRGLVYPLSELEKYIQEYDLNGEGSYIVTSKYPVKGSTRLCWDATRRMNQYGRFLNHAKHPNASLTPPKHVRGKWRIGFIAVRDIEPGHEVVWDYGVGKEVEWCNSVLINGVVTSAEESRDVMQEVRLD